MAKFGLQKPIRKVVCNSRVCAVVLGEFPSLSICIPTDASLPRACSDLRGLFERDKSSA